MEDVQVFPVILDRFCVVSQNDESNICNKIIELDRKQVAEQNSLIEI